MNNAEIVDLAHSEPAQHLRLHAARVRARHRRLSLRRRRQPLPGFFLRPRGDLARPRPSARGARDQEQAEKLTHVSNVFHTEPMARLAARLCAPCLATGACSSATPAPRPTRPRSSSRGAGATTAAPAASRSSPRSARSMAAPSARSARPARRNTIIGFQPLVPGFQHGPLRRRRGARQARSIDEHDRDLLVEPIQGEGGVVTPRPDYLARLRDLCDRRKHPADPRRGADRDGPHRQALRAMQHVGHQARHHDAGQGARRRPADRRDDAPKSEIAAGAHAGHPRLDLRRQSGRLRGGARGARRARAGRRDGECGRASAATCSSACASSARAAGDVREVRGMGMMIGIGAARRGQERRRRLPERTSAGQRHGRERAAPAAAAQADARRGRRRAQDYRARACRASGRAAAPTQR